MNSMVFDGSRSAPFQRKPYIEVNGVAVGLEVELLDVVDVGADQDSHRRRGGGLSGGLLGQGTWRPAGRRGLAPGGRQDTQGPPTAKRITIGGMEKSLLDPRNG
jgi:hypothetical protein